ncbi:MAG TPA: M28 family peptidase [Steroidobacteraceae bacterium]|nr:M28 family peptidase [Steroidobacteraceae bacterium]
MRRPLLALLGMLLTGCASTHKQPPPSTDVDDLLFREEVRMLASDELEGRRPGTPGEDKTVAFLTAQFRKLGLKPGNGESFVQQVPLIEATASARPTLTVLGRAGALPLAFGTDMVLWSPQSDPAVRLAHSGVVFVGYGIVAPEYDWNDYAQLDVRGKTVLVLDGDPGVASRDPTLFKGNALSVYGRAAYKLEEAGRQGAAAVLLVHDERSTGYGWDVVRNTWSGPHLELATTAADTSRPVLAGWVTAAAGRILLGAGGQDADALLAAPARRGFKGVALAVSIDATLTSTIRRFDSTNVVATLAGGARKNEYVIFSAHWDQLGRTAEGAIFSGAVDDASGVGGLLALAQSFARTRPPPDRSLLFIAFTADETQLLGVRYYLDHPVVPLNLTAAVLCLEDLHIGGRTRDLIVLQAGSSELEEYARGAALLQGREMRPDPRAEQGIYYRSDAIEFALRGVPALYAVSGIDDAARGPAFGQAQLDEYYAHRFGEPSDRYSEDWDVGGAVNDLSLYYAVGLRVATMHRFPRWYPNSEFSASHRHARETGGG